MVEVRKDTALSSEENKIAESEDGGTSRSEIRPQRKTEVEIQRIYRERQSIESLMDQVDYPYERSTTRTER